MADEVVRLKIVVDEDVRGAVRAKKAVEQVGESTEKLGEKFRETSHEAKSFDERLKELTRQRAEYAKKFIDTQDVEHRKRVTAISREIGLLEKMKRLTEGHKFDEHGSLLAFRGEGIPSLSLAHAMPAPGGLIAIATPVALALVTQIGAGLAGAIGGVGVVAGLAGAIASSIKSPEVQAAAKSFGGDLGATFFGAGGASVKPVVEGLAILGDDIKRLGLAETFGKAAPAITTFAGGIGDLVKNLMPGFNRLLDDAEPYADALADGLGDLGTSLGGLFQNIADSKGDIEGLRGLFDLINGTVNTTGNGLGWLSDRWYEMNVMLGDVTGALEDVYAWLPPVHTALAHGNDLTEQYTDSGEGAYRVIHELNREVRDQAVAMTLANLATANAAQNMANYKDWLDKTNKAVSDSIEEHLDYEKLMQSAKRGLEEFKEQLKENKGNWDASTQAGEANRQALLGQIGTAKDVMDAQIAAGDGSAEAQRKAQKEYNNTIDLLLDIARQAGLSEAAIRRMSGTYKIEIVAEVVGKQAADWSALRNQERKSESKATTTSHSGGTAGFASGGYPPLNTPFWVGENGPELMQLSGRSRVYSHGESMAMASASARPLQLDGGGLGQIVFNWLVKEIGNRGGTLAVLGIRD